MKLFGVCIAGNETRNTNHGGERVWERERERKTNKKIICN